MAGESPGPITLPDLIPVETPKVPYDKFVPLARRRLADEIRDGFTKITGMIYKNLDQFLADLKGKDVVNVCHVCPDDRTIGVYYRENDQLKLAILYGHTFYLNGYPNNNLAH